MVMLFPGHGLQNAPLLASGACSVVELKNIAMGMQTQANIHGVFNAYFLASEQTSIFERRPAPDTSRHPY
jgi:hypothetical protein